MKANYNSLVLLFGMATFLTGCTGSEDITVSVSPPEQLIWNATLNATQGSVLLEDNDTTGLTRAAFVGGNTDRFMTAWDQGDVVMVYKGSTKVGEMTPASSSYGTIHATLNGTLTGPFSEGDVLTLYLPSKSMDFTGQKGTIQSISSKSFQTNTVTVLSAADNILTLSDVDMTHRQTYARFYLTDEEGGARLHPSRLTIHALSGGNTVLTTDDDGNVLSTGDVVIEPVIADGEYPGEIYAALLNENDAIVTYQLTATVGTDIYVGPVSSQSAYAPNLSIYKGQLRNVRRMLRKTTAVSTLTVTDIASKVFTGFAIVPDDAEIIVKDGEETLTQGTDYTFEFSNNVNVGDATVTITGLADAGATAATKYLGTATKTFQITKATPIIVMDDADMTLVNNLTQNTGSRTISRVFIDNNGNGTWDEGTDYDITALSTVTYTSSNEAVATVDASTGDVTAAGPGTCTVTATVAEADNWFTNAVVASYTVNVEQEVHGGNGVNPWDDKDGANEEGGKIYVE